MIERIDHAAKAERLIRLTDGYLERNALQAQVHATLALVEQQRIANLLAFAQVDHDAGDGGRLYTGLEGAMRCRKEASEALGLS
jgi:hypothetical protein